MDGQQILKDYDEFVTDQYMKIKSQCCSYGELKEQIKRVRKVLMWKQGYTLGEKLEALLQKEIDSALETLPILGPK